MTDFNRIFETCKNIAVVGISDKPDRDSGPVALRLHQAGFNVVGVHPTLKNVHGIPVYPDLTSISENIDLIDIFLAGDKLPQIKQQIVDKKPKVVWFQLGVHNTYVQQELESEGITVIVDHCIAIELRNFKH
ncbi:MAG: CoA-binding protein [Ignavibacteriales bacterium]|nr:CoA-binding protein [Ignavibacteriales bacterium]